MKHKKEHKSKGEHKGAGHAKLGMVEPMAHGKGSQHLKPVKHARGK